MNEFDSKEYEKISKILSVKNTEATIEQLKEKQHYLAKQKFELYQMVEQISKEEKEIKQLLNEKTK